MSDQVQPWDAVVLAALYGVLLGLWWTGRRLYEYSVARRALGPRVVRRPQATRDVSAATPLGRDRAARGAIDLERLYGDTTRLEMDAEGRRRQYLEKLR